jgi:hypothetical protein
MNPFGKCEFCSSKAPLRVSKSDFEFPMTILNPMKIAEDAYVCNSCWKLMQNPITALPLIRGHLTLTLRGLVPQKKLDQMINNFMEKISKWKPQIKN